MSNVIHLLPDAVANQIAAGEVIQRPASIVKELVENAIDAGATTVKVVVVDAGRTLIQVIDNGCGMSETDARLAFERHATSKIAEAADLFALNTMGFRGEALASIAAVAQVELLTRREDDELGVKLELAASKVESQEPVALAQPGSQFLVRNLFFNIPARRNFLKSDTVEKRHIVTEFLRVALAHPGVTFSLTANSSLVYSFPQGNLRQRVASVAGKALAQHLLPIDVQTSIVAIKGFVGTPETARKNSTDQYFFANNRYMRNPYLHKAVMEPYRKLIPQDLTPAYFVYLTVDPKSIDVNIHPQKTEIKFEDDAAIWQILSAAVRECLGKFNIMPSIDFDNGDNVIDMPPMMQAGDASGAVFTDVFQPSADIYNPFERESSGGRSQSYGSGAGQAWHNPMPKVDVSGWEDLYAGVPDGTPVDAFEVPSAIGSEPHEVQSAIGFSDDNVLPLTDVASAIGSADRFVQVMGKYILAPTQQGVMVIDQRRAHERIQYNTLIDGMQRRQAASQRLVFPEIVAVSADDACVIEEMSVELMHAGMEVKYDADKGHVEVLSIPDGVDPSAVHSLIDALVFDFRNGEIDVCGSVTEYVAKILASQSALPYGKTLTNDEMSMIYNRLLAGESPSLSPDGKVVFRILDAKQLDAMF